MGLNGINHSTDVTLIQKLLNAQNTQGKEIPLKVDGEIGNKTILRIEAFQKNILKMVHPDGCVDPNGKTFKKLASAQAKPSAKTAITLNFGPKGTNLLKSIEQLATTPYDDQTGKDITEWVDGATIGYGHLISKSDWSKYKDGITEVQALSLLNSDLKPFVNKVKTKVSANVTQNEFDAMVILAFNIGPEAFSNSSVLKMINDSNAKTAYTTIEAAWKAWKKSQGAVNKGLINRRQAEWNIYSKEVYQKW